MTAPIRVALFGLGNMGCRWRRVILANERWNLVATVDPLAPEASHTSLTSRAFDAAIVATPTPTHYDVVRDLLRSRFPVLVEKPLADTEERCRALVALTAPHSTLLAVGHVERFNPAVRVLAKVLREERIGKPIHISCTRVGGYPASVTPGNNVSLDLAVHDLDILRTLIGPLSVVASVCHATVRPDVCDTAEILLRADAGPSASVHTNWISPCKLRTIRVTGTAGVAFVDLIAQSVELVVGQEHTLLPVPRNEPLAAELDAFADAIDGRPFAPLCLGDDAAEAVALAERALHISASAALIAA